MLCRVNTKAAKRYTRRVAVTMSVYVIAIFLCTFALRHLHFGRPLTILLAVIPSLPIIAVIVIVGLYLKEETDEFQRALCVQTMLWGLGSTLAISSVWGLLELFVDIPHVPIFYTFPAFWFFYGVCKPFVRLRYRSSDSDA
jgi:hypothetical protein